MVQECVWLLVSVLCWRSLGNLIVLINFLGRILFKDLLAMGGHLLKNLWIEWFWQRRFRDYLRIRQNFGALRDFYVFAKHYNEVSSRCNFPNLSFLKSEDLSWKLSVPGVCMTKLTELVISPSIHFSILIKTNSVRIITIKLANLTINELNFIHK